MKFIFLCFLTALIFLCLQSLAQRQRVDGCIVYPYGAVTTSPNVYQIPLPGVSVPATEQPDIRNKPVYDGQGASVPVAYSCYADPPDRTIRQCAVRALVSGNYKWWGGVLAQNFYRCPLDDYISWLILPVGIFGFFLIRRKSLLIS